MSGSRCRRSRRSRSLRPTCFLRVCPPSSSSIARFRAPACLLGRLLFDAFSPSFPGGREHAPSNDISRAAATNCSDRNRKGVSVCYKRKRRGANPRLNFLPPGCWAAEISSLTRSPVNNLAGAALLLGGGCRRFLFFRRALWLLCNHHAGELLIGRLGNDALGN